MDEKIAALAQELNVPSYITPTATYGVFDDFVEIGVNAIHPLEPNHGCRGGKVKRGHQFCLIWQHRC